MPLPKATPSSTKAPGFYLRVNLLTGPGGAGTAALRALLIAHKSSAGNIVPEEEVRTVYGPDDVLTALGEGTLGHLAAIQLYERFGAIQLDLVAPDAPTGATASGSYVIDGTPTDTNLFEFDVKGVKIGPVPWAEGETSATFHTRIKEYIAAERNLPVVPATGSATSVVDLDARTPGAWGNDITFGVTKISGNGGTVTLGDGTSTSGNLADGAGELDIANALALVEVQEYAAIGLATSNADATDNTGDANPELLMDHIDSNLFSGQALLQYGFVGHTGSIANVKAGAIGRNSAVMTYAYVQNAQSLPAEVMGNEMGDALASYTNRPNYNRIGNAAPGIIGSKDKNGDKLRGPELEDLLRNGVTPYDFLAGTDEIVLVAPITTHSVDANGNPDYRCYYQSDVFGEYAMARDLRAFLPQQFPNCSITDDLPPDADPLPENVVERRDVESITLDRMRGWVPKGVLHGPKFETAVEAGRFAVEIDEDDESQVNIYIPNDIVKPLAKISVVMDKTRRP